MSGIDGEHALVFPPNVLGDGPSCSFSDLLKEANFSYFTAILNLGSVDFFPRGKQNISHKIIFAEKDEIMPKRINMFIYFQKLGNPQ